MYLKKIQTNVISTQILGWRHGVVRVLARAAAAASILPTKSSQRKRLNAWTETGEN
jgi:hypothetical protein